MRTGDPGKNGVFLGKGGFVWRRYVSMKDEMNGYIHSAYVNLK
jgi:hypothetical protein